MKTLWISLAVTAAGLLCALAALLVQANQKHAIVIDLTE